MLQDPVKGILVPLSPEEARATSKIEVGFDPSARFVQGGWLDVSACVARSCGTDLPLGEILAAIPALDDPSAASYDCAYAAMIGGNYAAAASGFATLALAQGPVAASLYGLALALEELGRHEEAESLAGFVSELPGYEDPRAAALAGYAAFQRRQSKAARIYLAKAARIARLQPEFRGVQRFAQRVLLMQQFALGD